MSIIPVGKRREQVAQGPLKNQSILESDLFKRFGQTATSLVDDPVQKQQQPRPQQPQTDLEQATMGGGLDRGSMADQLEMDRTPPNDMMQGQHGGGVAGAGTSPAAQFLGQGEDEEQDSGMTPEAMYQQQEQLIRQFIRDDFGLRLKANPDGTYTATIKPPAQVPIARPMEFLNQLVQTIGGTRIDSETGDKTEVGASVQITYRPSGAPDKIHKPGTRR